MDNLKTLIFFITGSIVGSFLNVCISRLPREESIVSPASHCLNCGKPVKWYDNIPIFSYIILNGKCRECKTAIGWRYLAVEVLTALFFVFTYKKFGITFEACMMLIFGSSLIILTFIDLEHQILPSAINYFLLVLGIIISFVRKNPTFIDAVLGSLVGGGILFTIAFISKIIIKQEAMGGGDVRLGFALGAWLGVKQMLEELFIAFAVASVIGVILLAAKIKKRRDPIPFGPFLSIGAIIVIFYSEWINSNIINLFSLP